MFRVLFNPFQDFRVALGQFFFQGFGINAREVEEALVERAGVMILAVFAGERGAALVEAARQNDVAAEPDVRTARREFGQIRSVE